MTPSHITTHVLDTSTGKPAAGIPVRLEAGNQGAWSEVAAATTDTDGRVKDLGPEVLESGTYRLQFTTAEYFANSNTATFFPEVVLVFTVDRDEPHYHVPLLLSPFSFSSYRGS
ncbi:hydroxyisourate hydrolase [Pseudarthrobacter sulfonivorans]|uniref:hydroxyisourate hydrolase n=1 Tax=Pseudarthrobacter sulfonivorans TaxID=121292 RepID=UPI002105325C|nr:hydroxyisourate hydrolase [Pseudarthrobacter sulfonivorans]